ADPIGSAVFVCILRGGKWLTEEEEEEETVVEAQTYLCVGFFYLIIIVNWIIFLLYRIICILIMSTFCNIAVRYRVRLLVCFFILFLLSLFGVSNSLGDGLSSSFGNSMLLLLHPTIIRQIMINMIVEYNHFAKVDIGNKSFLKIYLSTMLSYRSL